MTLPLGLFHAPRERVEVTTCTGQVIAGYRYGRHLQRPHLHPLAPPGGTPMTLASPHDHPWHHGLFLSWKFVDGADFWQGSGGRAVPGRLDIVAHRDDRVSWTHAVSWRAGADGDGEPIMCERRDLTVRVAAPGRLAVRWTSTFEVEQPVRLHADERGYGGLGIRLIRDLQLRPRLRTTRGEAPAQEVRGTPSSWSSWYGRCDESGEWVGVTLYEDPGNPRYPAPVFVPAQPALAEMAFLASGFVFEHDYTIRPDQPLRLGYGLLLHRGEPPDDPGTWQGWFATEEEPA